MRLLFLAAAGLLLPAGGLTAAPRAQSQEASQFDVIQFFEGRTEGRGVLKVALRSPETIRVESRGRVQPDGTLLLVQEVSRGDRPKRKREWRMREVAPGRYTGTLSDAAGPVTAEAKGNRLHLRFRMKGGLEAEQWLTLAPNGRSAHNLLTVRKFGITVGKLDETIRKLD